MWTLVVLSVLIVAITAQDPDDYCTLFETQCPSQFAADYNTNAACVAYASLFDAGTTGDTAGNTVACREYHAGVANADDSLHCGHAGLNGGNVCGTYCENYCFARMIDTGAGCAETNMTLCMDRCSYFPSIDVSNPQVLPEMSAVSGNSVQCRIYHAAAAFNLDDGVHCEHSNLEAGGACGDLCENYCYYMDGVCDFPTYADDAECQRACGAMGQGENGDTSGPTLHCRLYHLGVAATTSDFTHCAHADLRSGDDVCGSPCEHLCEINTNFCTDEADGGYNSFDQCLDICAALPLGTAADTSGNTVGCRNYHLDFAILGGNDAMVDHCQHSGVAGAGQCGDWCESYCAQTLVACPDNFADEEACMDFCATVDGNDLEPYVYSDASADNMQCRIYHIGAASWADDSHCPHASEDGGQVCVAQPTADTTPAPETSQPAEESTAETAETGSVATLMVFIVSFAVVLF